MKLFAKRSEERRPLIDEGEVVGERGPAIVGRESSSQGQLGPRLTLALVLSLGLGVLGWYYTHTARAPQQARQRAAAATVNRAASDLPLPPLAGVARLRASASAARQGGESGTAPTATSQDSTGAAGGSTMPALSVASTVPPAAAAPTPRSIAGAAITDALTAVPTANVRAATLARQLSGAAFARADGSAALAGEAVPSPHAATAGTLAEASLQAGSEQPPRSVGSPGAEDSSTRSQSPSVRSADSLATRLQSSANPVTRARVLQSAALLLPKGAFIDCTLETAIDSSLPGLTTCVTATDTFGADGRVVLLERGSKLVGETRGQVQQGAARVFVLWTEARTPVGVVVPLDSPGADELGRSGLPGSVDRHFWQRFGAAILVSTIDGGVQAAVQSANHGGGAVIYNPSATQDVMTEVLKGTLDIAPTVVKRNGDRIAVLVARDVDFSSVYELRRTATDR